MLKKCAACLLVLALCVLCFGCGKQPGAPADGNSTTKAAADGKQTTAPAQTLAQGSKIAFLVGTGTQDPQFNPTALALAGGYDSSVMTVALPEDAIENPTNVVRTALATAEDPLVKVMIFSGTTRGVLSAVQQVRQKHEDLTLIVCDPVEDAAQIAEYANLILRVDYDQYAADAVQQAKDMGAEHFVFYSSSRELQLYTIQSMQRAAEAACKKLKLTFKTYACPDMLESGRTQESGEQYMAEDAARRNTEYGKKTALFCVSPALQGAVARMAVTYGMVMPATFRPSPLSLAAGLGVSLDGRETDAAYAMQQLTKKAEELGIRGHVATWGADAPDVLLRTAFAWAQGALEGKAQTDEAAMRACLSDDALTVTTQGNICSVSAQTTAF